MLARKGYGCYSASLEMISASYREDPAARYRGVLQMIANRYRSGEMPPTAREVAREAGYKSSRDGQKILLRLVESNYIERGEAPSRKRRPIKLTERGWQAVGRGSVLGRIAAGRGLEAIADEEAYSVAGDLLLSRSGRQRYLLRVVGESMVDAGIRNGDLLVVEEDVDPPDGSVVVALLAEEEVTVKRLYRQNGHVRLKAESASHEDIVVPYGEVEIRGRVIASIHSF